MVTYSKPRRSFRSCEKRFKSVQRPKEPVFLGRLDVSNFIPSEGIVLRLSFGSRYNLPVGLVYCDAHVETVSHIVKFTVYGLSL